MSKRKIVDQLPLNLIKQDLSENTQEIIDNFLSLYKRKDGYESAISYLFYHSGKQDIKSLNINDLYVIKEKIDAEDTKSSKFSYIRGFFRYLYAYDLLIDETGFDKLWLKSKEKDEIEKARNKTISKKSNNKSSKNEIDVKEILKVEELDRIENIIKQQHSGRKHYIKYFILWYLLFETDVPIEYIRYIKQINYYAEGIIDSDNNKIKLPTEYLEFWENYYKRGNNGLRDIYHCIKNLGELVGINDLTPSKIRNTREISWILCPNCQNKYRSIIDNWSAINGKILCINCAEELKKNSSVVNQMLPNSEISLNNTMVVSPLFYTFDEYKKMLNKNIDYKKLHEYQMHIGDLGEAFVLDYEYEKLKDTEYFERIIDVSKDSEKGYDILSYDKMGIELYIEVKTSTNIDEDFYMTEHERNIAKQLYELGKKYLIYRVENILADNKEDIILTIIDDVFNSDKYCFYPYQWRIGSM